uniref:MULE transposase domain-containing protein n=1 Tax=Lactuca sativa TaxID=4236 RepID=A0A9R1WB50_LACSA|nr:hypothetical protein LSAT_V11C300101930 [Lactuca sativa]
MSYDKKKLGYRMRAFQTSLHPIIIIDEAHLKGKYLGTMFLAVGMDVGKTKSGESWIWFLSRLKDYIRDMLPLAIISGRVNSIKMAIQAVFLKAYYGICCLHLLMNMRVMIGNQERTQIFVLGG